MAAPEEAAFLSPRVKKMIFLDRLSSFLVIRRNSAKSLKDLCLT